MMSMPLCSPTGRMTITIYRGDDGSYLMGKWIPPKLNPIEIKGVNVQPNLTWNQMKPLTEGERSKEAIVIYSPKELLMADQHVTPPIKADIVCYNGKYYEIKTSMTYKMGVLNHCEAVALRIDDLNEF